MKDKLQIFQPLDNIKIAEEELLKKYPKIFCQKSLPMTETAMCWGICCGKGWFWLIDILCQNLQYDTDNNGYPQVEAVQVKEKFGGLRFYTNGEDKKHSGMIWLAESMSLHICEECGTTKNVSQNEQGWIRTLCKECRKNG